MNQLGKDRIVRAESEEDPNIDMEIFKSNEYCSLQPKGPSH